LNVFAGAAEKYMDAWLDYLKDPSTEKYDVVVEKWTRLCESATPFLSAIGEWMAECHRIFGGMIPFGEVSVIVATTRLIAPPTEPVPATVESAATFAKMATAVEKVMGNLKSWMDAWSMYNEMPSGATWRMVTYEWHKLKVSILDYNEMVTAWNEVMPSVMLPENAKNAKKQARDAWRLMREYKRADEMRKKEIERELWRKTYKATRADRKRKAR
jgi:hypothetical protein